MDRAACVRLPENQSRRARKLMQEILFEYELTPTTWAYLSALLILGIYFKFHRFWSVRNLDLVGLIIFSPGILMVFYGMGKVALGQAGNVAEVERVGYALVHVGYVWQFVVGAAFLIRLLLDPLMVRRPLLEPNLNASGLMFTGGALLIFLSANLLATKPPPRLEHVLARQQAAVVHSPGYPYFYYVASFSNAPKAPTELPKHPVFDYPASTETPSVVVRFVAMLALVGLVVGLVLVGYRHFDNLQTGVAAASLYLLIPYVGQMSGRIDHSFPALLLVWAVVAYRRPFVAGSLLGMAGGLVFYPLFLLPLWCSFYWRRGLLRFIAGAAGMLLLLVVGLLLLSDDMTEVGLQLRQMFGGTLLSHAGAAGFWESYHVAYRIPAIALFVVLAFSLGLWPAHKNLGTLLSCTAATMLAAQYVKIHEGGLYMAWFLALLVLTIFRPNLEDRVAQTAVLESRTAWPIRLLTWWTSRKPA